MRTPTILDGTSATPDAALVAARVALRPAAFALPAAAAVGVAAHVTFGPGAALVGDMWALAVVSTWSLSAVLGLRTARVFRRTYGPSRLLVAIRAGAKARSIVAALEEQWSACRIEIHAFGTQNWYGEERRNTLVHFPGGAKLQLDHAVGATRVHFDVDRSGRGDILSNADAEFVAQAMLRIQIHALASELDLPWDIGPHALSHAIGAMSTVDAATKRFEASRDFGWPAVVVERRTIPSTDVSVTACRWAASSMHHDLLVEGRRTGVLRLPAAAFSLVVRGDEAQVAAKALDMASTAVRTPIVPGPSRAERLAAVARVALARDPDLADASGTPIASLIDSHLPRLVERHRAAEPSVRVQADEAFERGLDVVARAVGESIDALAGRSLDDLRTEVRFLETRHPQRDPLLSPEERP